MFYDFVKIKFGKHFRFPSLSEGWWWLDKCLQVEVFNILFIREQEKRHVVHCLDCSRKQASQLEGFVCLEEYRMSELMQVFDNFVLHPVVSAMFSNCVTRSKNVFKQLGRISKLPSFQNYYTLLSSWQTNVNLAHLLSTTNGFLV